MADAHSIVGASTMTGMIFFGGFMLLSLVITYVASRRVSSADSFYTAGGAITPVQNGFALAGDFMAAAGVLGLSGLTALAGVDGVMLAIAAIAAWPLMLYLFAEPLRNLGRYTFADVIEYRLGTDSARLYAALCAILTLILLLAMQVTGAGSLITVLFGLPYELAIVAVCAFMVTYVLFGGMLATTWVQIVKCVLLVGSTVILTGMILDRFGFDPSRLMKGAIARGGPSLLLTGGFFTSPLELLSSVITTVFGLAAFPHVLMRFFTVKDGEAARASVLYAVFLVAIVMTSTIVLGYGATALFGTEGIRAVDRGGNMAVPMLAGYFGGSLFLGFVSAVMFATILATVSGMLLAGSATLSHDLWVNVVRRGRASEREQFIAPKLATLVLGIVTMLFGMAFKGQNVAVLSLVGATIPASTLFPILFLAIYWPHLTHHGAVSGLIGGLVLTVGLVSLTPIVQVTLLGHASAILPMQNVAIFAVPLTFVLTMVVSRLTANDADRSRYQHMKVRIFAGKKGG